MTYDPLLYQFSIRIRIAILAILAIFDPKGHARRASELARSLEGECYRKPAPWDPWERWPSGVKRPSYGVDHPRFVYTRDLVDQRWPRPYTLTSFGSVSFYSIAWPDRGLAWDPWKGYHALDVEAFQAERAAP